MKYQALHFYTKIFKGIFIDSKVQLKVLLFCVGFVNFVVYRNMELI